MRNQKYSTEALKCAIGVVLIIAAILLAILYTLPYGAMQALPFVLGGMGIVAFIGGIAGALSVRLMKKDPNFAKEVTDFFDERAIAIENKAKAKAGDFTAFLLWALIIFLAVMQVELLIIIVFVGVMLVRMFVLHYFIRRYTKQM